MRKNEIITFISYLTLILVIGGVCIFLLFSTESGKRTMRDLQSNFTGGVERTVEVYDVHGEIIKTFEGRFDVTYDANRIRFDDEDGKRHTIYYTTGTVIITER